MNYFVGPSLATSLAQAVNKKYSTRIDLGKPFKLWSKINGFSLQFDSEKKYDPYTNCPELEEINDEDNLTPKNTSNI